MPRLSQLKRRLSQPERIQLWLDRLIRFAASRQTVAAFCADEGCSPPAFYQWKRRLAANPTAAEGTSLQKGSASAEQSALAVKRLPDSNTIGGQRSAFTEISFVAAPPIQAWVLLPNGVKIELGTDPQTVSEILSQLFERSLPQNSLLRNSLPQNSLLRNSLPPVNSPSNSEVA